MAKKVKAKEAKETKRVIYQKYFCTDELGESDAFYEVKDKKLIFITGWFHNDAMWRPEYMSGLLSYFGVGVEILPSKYEAQAEDLMREAFGV
jgi:hypothetical protein